MDLEVAKVRDTTSDTTLPRLAVYWVKDSPRIRILPLQRLKLEDA